MTETIKAILTGNNTIEIEGNTYTHRTPILHAARVLAKEGRKGKIECYRNTGIAIVADIQKSAKLTVIEYESYIAARTKRYAIDKFIWFYGFSFPEYKADGISVVKI